jgi:O-antigen/teichoic acid export membrane protein
MLFAVIPLSNNPLYGWAGVMLGYKVFILFLQVSCFRRFCGAIVYRSDMLNPRRLFVLFRLGISLQLINFSQALADQANVYILSFFRGPEGVALYNPVDKVAIMFRSVVMTFANQLVTFATKAHTKGDKDKLSKLLLSGTKYTLLPGVLFGTGMFIFAEPFSRLWLSGVLAGEYLIVARVMRAYAVTELILYLSGTQWPLLLAHRTVKFPTFMYIITAVVNILFSIYFVGFTAAGIAGVLYGTIIGKGIRVPVLIFYSLRLLNIKGKDYIRETLSGPLCCFLFTAMAGWLLIIFFSCDSWIRLFSMAVVMALVWGMACWIVGFNGEDRLRVISLIKKNFKH